MFTRDTMMQCEGSEKTLTVERRFSNWSGVRPSPDSGEQIRCLQGDQLNQDKRRTYQMPEKGNELNWDKEEWNKLGQIMFTLLLFANCCNIVLFAESSWGLSVLT